MIQHGETWKGQELVVRAPGRRPEMHAMYRPLEDARRDPGCSAMFQYPPAIGNNLDYPLVTVLNLVLTIL